MTAFHAWTTESVPGLHLWRLSQSGQAAELKFDRQPLGTDADGFQVFRAELNHQVHEPLGFKLFHEDQNRSNGRKMRTIDFSHVSPISISRGPMVRARRTARAAARILSPQP